MMTLRKGQKNAPPAIPGDVGPYNVFDKPVRADKKQRIPPPEAVSEFAPGNTANLIIISDCSVSRKRPNQIAYRQKSLAAKKCTDAAAAGAQQEPPKKPNAT